MSVSLFLLNLSSSTTDSSVGGSSYFILGGLLDPSNVQCSSQASPPLPSPRPQLISVSLYQKSWHTLLHKYKRATHLGGSCCIFLEQTYQRDIVFNIQYMSFELQGKKK